MEAIKQTFAKCKAQKRAALVAYITAGYPTVEEAVDILLGLENGGAGKWIHPPKWKLLKGTIFTDIRSHISDIIELGIPFTDPIADGPTIQTANTKALENGVTLTTVLELVRTARSRGLQTPLMLMGYFNPVLKYGEERMLRDCKEAGVNGFIMVDLPPEEAVRFRDLCSSAGWVCLNFYFFWNLFHLFMIV